MNRQNSLPDSEVQFHDRKSSAGSALNEERLGRSHSNLENNVSEGISVNNLTSGRLRKESEPEVEKWSSEDGLEPLPVGIVMDREERRVSGEDKVPVSWFFLETSNVGVQCCCGLCLN